MIYENFLEKFTDWRPTTLYWQRFSIAERFGKTEIKNVYNEIFSESKRDYKLLTELILTLKHKCWEHCKYHDCQRFCECYDSLYKETKLYARTHLEKDELNYLSKLVD